MAGRRQVLDAAARVPHDDAKLVLDCRCAACCWLADAASTAAGCRAPRRVAPGEQRRDLRLEPRHNLPWCLGLP